MRQYFLAPFVYVFKFKALRLVEGENVKRADWLKTKSALVDCSSSTYAKALKSQVKNCYRLSIVILYLRMHTLKTIAKTFGSTFKIIKCICITSRVSLPYMTNCRWYTHLFSSIFQSFHTTFNQCLFVSLFRAYYFHPTPLEFGFALCPWIVPLSNSHARFWSHIPGLIRSPKCKMFSNPHVDRSIVPFKNF